MMRYTDPGTQIPAEFWHSPAVCGRVNEDGTPDYCVIHRPSSHHMRKWQFFVRASTLIERLCPEHGVGHPDPDSLAYFMRFHPEWALDVHACCGCCVPPPAKPLGHGSDIPVTAEEDEMFQ